MSARYLFAGWTLMVAAVSVHLAAPGNESGPFLAGAAAMLLLLFFTSEDPHGH